MLKVINRKITSKIEIEIDYCLAFLLRCPDEDTEQLIYWRTGHWEKSDCKHSLLETYINSRDGTLAKIKIVLTGGIDCISDRSEIEQIKKAIAIPGIPRFDISNLKLERINEEKSDFKLNLNEEHLVIKLAKDICIAEVFYVDNLKFGMDANRNLVLVALLDVYNNFNIPDLRSIILDKTNFNTDKLTLIINNKVGKNLYIKKEIINFLHDIRNLGICQPIDNLEYFKYLTSQESYEADDFITEIFYLEEIDTDRNLFLFEKVRAMFVDRFGCCCLDVKL